MELKEISEKEYQNFIKKFPDTLFFQSVEWASFKAQTEWHKTIVGLYQEKELLGASILLYRTIPVLKKKVYYSPRGFMIDYNDFDLIKTYTEELKKYLKKNNALELIINPYISYVERDKDGNIVGEPNDRLLEYMKELGYQHNGLYIDAHDKKDLEPRWISVLDLDKDIDTLLKDMRQTTRWMINKSEKNCITIKEASFDELKDFKKVMVHTAERRDFIDRPLSYYELMYNELSKNNMIKVLLASINLQEFQDTLSKEIETLQGKIEVIKDNPKKQNTIQEYENQIKAIDKRINGIKQEQEQYGDNPIIAVGLYISYGAEVVYLFGGSYKEFMSYGAQYLMQYKMIQYAKENGYKKLNFYGIDGNFNKESENYGLFDFKRGFNADVVELIGEFHLIIDETSYNLFQLMYGLYKKIRRM